MGSSQRKIWWLASSSILAPWFGLAPLPAQVPAHAVLLNPTANYGAVRSLTFGDTIVVVGHTSGTFLNFVHVARSSDRGRTWPLLEQPIAYAPIVGDVVATGSDVHISVNAQWTGPHVISSHDGGVTWNPPVRVSAASNANSFGTPRLHAHGNTVNVVWYEPRATGRYWSNQSTDGGRTWSTTDTRLDVGLPVGQQPTDVTLLTDGSELHVFYQELGTPGSTIYQRSLDDGATWLPAARLIQPTVGGVFAQSANRLLVAGWNTNVAITSVDQGTTWTPVQGFGIPQVQAAAVTDQTILLVGLQPGPIGPTTLIQVSTDGGASWLAAPYQIPSNRFNYTVTAQATSSALFVHYAFQNDQQSPPGLVIQSDDAGQTWRRVDGDAGLGFEATDDGAVVLTKTGWNGLDRRVWVLEGHTALGVGTAGTGAIVPELAGRDLAGLGRTFTLDVNGTRGGSLGALFTSFGAAQAMPLGAATFWLPQPITSMVFVASGTPGAAGAGAATMAVAVPNTAALAGVRLLSQALILDPLAAFDFCATRAIESWVR